jgi:hypothetical protein
MFSPRARALYFLRGDLVLADVFDRGEERLARAAEIHVGRELRAEVHVARIVQLTLGAPDARGDALLHERPVQPAGGRVAEDLRQDVDRRIVRMAARHDAI